MPLRIAALAAVALVATLAAPRDADAALFFLFKPTAAKPGDRVTIRTAWTPANFRPSQRERPLGRPYRLYLVPNSVAGDVHSQLDDRLHFVGIFVPDKRGRGVLTFTLPPVASASYAAAVWCPSCAPHSRGSTFFTLRVDRNVVPRYRSAMQLRVRMPPASSTSCPVTRPNDARPPGMSRFVTNYHGNGGLWTHLPADGVLQPLVQDGQLFWKFGWKPRDVGGTLALEGRRLDAIAPPLNVLAYFFSGGGWATPVTFPTPGCWLIVARDRDVKLSFVLRVIRP